MKIDEQNVLILDGLGAALEYIRNKLKRGEKLRNPVAMCVTAIKHHAPMPTSDPNANSKAVQGAIKELTKDSPSTWVDIDTVVANAGLSEEVVMETIAMNTNRYATNQDRTEVCIIWHRSHHDGKGGSHRQRTRGPSMVAEARQGLWVAGRQGGVPREARAWPKFLAEILRHAPYPRYQQHRGTYGPPRPSPQLTEVWPRRM